MTQAICVLIGLNSAFNIRAYRVPPSLLRTEPLAPYRLRIEEHDFVVPLAAKVALPLVSSLPAQSIKISICTADIAVALPNTLQHWFNLCVHVNLDRNVGDVSLCKIPGLARAPPGCWVPGNISPLRAAQAWLENRDVSKGLVFGLHKQLVTKMGWERGRFTRDFEEDEELIEQLQLELSAEELCNEETPEPSDDDLVSKVRLCVQQR